MADLLFGVETEYAVAGMPRGGAVVQEAILQNLVERARKELIHLPDIHSASGFFLGNGSRFYIDCGSHPEFCTPECANPWDAVRYIQAGNAILAGLASSVESECMPGTEIMCFRGNVDYGGDQTTWGCHESYMHRISDTELRPHIIPHLISRLIYTGAGGFNPLSPGLEFTLSPRMAHFRREDTESSTSERGIWDTKSEPLCSGYNRLHVLCGESLCSETATFLKVGVTALIIAMADAGFTPGSEVQLDEPVLALQLVAGDITCKRQIRMANGGYLTAIAIQRHYLEQVEAHLSDGFLPPWAEEVCHRWRAILGQLEDAPGSSEHTLDWAIKRTLYANHLRSLGMCWDDLPALNQAMDQVASGFEGSHHYRKSVSLESHFRPKRRLPKKVASLESLFQSQGIRWDDLWKFLSVKKTLCEIDTRFGQLGPKGIFQSLDEAGVLNHKVTGIDNIQHAMAEPPAMGRAHVRGKAIQRLAGSGNSRCDWQVIVNYGDEQVLDLSDPFTREESWRSLDAQISGRPRMSNGPGEFLDFGDDLRDTAQSPHWRRQEAIGLVLSGNYAGAEVLLRRLLQERYEMPSTHCHMARVLLMTDREAEAREQIDQAWSIRAEANSYVVVRILFFQYIFAIFDGVDGIPLVQLMKDKLLERGAHLDWTICPMLDHLRGRLGEANYKFLRALADGLCDASAMPRLNRFSRWRRMAEAA